MIKEVENYLQKLGWRYSYQNDVLNLEIFIPNVGWYYTYIDGNQLTLDKLKEEITLKSNMKIEQEIEYYRGRIEVLTKKLNS